MAEALKIEPESPSAHYVETLMQVDLWKTEEATALLKRVESYGREKRLPAISVLITQHAALSNVEIRRPRKRCLPRSRGRSLIRGPRFTTCNGFPWMSSPSLHGRESVSPPLPFSFNARAIPPFDWLVLDPYLKGLQSDPRFKEVAAKSRLQFDEMLRIVDKARASGEMPPYLERPLKDLLARIGS
ncbi:MAG: hypothetical protein H0W18_16555 [Acidobacteria bacterium]|nr:hypothetical protein [Acidobacteriota bacterium]